MLRPLTLSDCTERYVSWLRDAQVNRYLETRWSTQTLDTVRTFVATTRERADSKLFAILTLDTSDHIGNIKLGPINHTHLHSDISYFIGERSAWGHGYATDAIRLACYVAFDLLGLHRVQAGLYESNVASARALTKVGFTLEGRLMRKLRGPTGWEDHLLYGLLRDNWRADHDTVTEGIQCG